jgi:phage I-like protein
MNITHFTFAENPIETAACFIDLNGSAPAEIQLTPDGVFSAKDGRPYGLPGWRVDAQSAANVQALSAASKDLKVIDYEHQTMHTHKTGQKAPAAGWFSRVIYRPGAGLFAVGVEWTAEAIADIKAKRYRYISPVIAFNKATGAVTQILMAALTNYPAIDGMKGVDALKAGNNIEALSAEETYVCARLGLTTHEFLNAKFRQEWSECAALHAEFGEMSDYLAYRRAEAAGLTRIHCSSVTR